VSLYYSCVYKTKQMLNYKYPGLYYLIVMATDTLREKIAAEAPFANNDATGEYTGDIYAEDDR